MGYQRQTVRGNWKLYAENPRDQYHGSLLHKFQGTFLTKTTTLGELWMDGRHRHSIVCSTVDKTYQGELADSADLVHNVDRLEDTSMLKFIPEYAPDYPYSSAVCALFPNLVLQQIRNSLATRQIRPQGLDKFELFFTIFGFEDDAEELTNLRLLQINIGGPAGVGLGRGRRGHRACPQSHGDAATLGLSRRDGWHRRASDSFLYAHQ